MSIEDTFGLLLIGALVLVALQVVILIYSREDDL